MLCYHKENSPLVISPLGTRAVKKTWTPMHSTCIQRYFRQSKLLQNPSQTLMTFSSLQTSSNLVSLCPPFSALFLLFSFHLCTFSFYPTYRVPRDPWTVSTCFWSHLRPCPPSAQLPLMTEPLTSDKKDLTLKKIRHYVFWYAIISTNSSHGP